jgi:hypothetical protein
MRLGQPRTALNRTIRNALNFKDADRSAIRLASGTDTACNSANSLGYLFAGRASSSPAPVFGGVAQLVRAADP